MTLLTSGLKERRGEGGAPTDLQGRGWGGGCTAVEHSVTGWLPAAWDTLQEGAAGRLTWNGGCDRWLDGVGLLHEGLDAGGGGPDRVINRDYSSGYSTPQVLPWPPSAGANLPPPTPHPQLRFPACRW